MKPSLHVGIITLILIVAALTMTIYDVNIAHRYLIKDFIILFLIVESMLLRKGK